MFHSLRLTLVPHQVLEEGCQLSGENDKLDEGRADIAVIPVTPGQVVFPELVHGLNVLLLIFHVSYDTENTLNKCGLQLGSSFI